MPPPTGTNDDLLPELASETFFSNGVVGRTNFPAGGSGSSQAARSAVTFSYDARAAAYTVTSGGSTGTFATSTRDPALSTPQLDVYRVGNNTLTLSRPGTAGALTYQYVGSAYWQRTVMNAAGTTADLDAFVYGIRTQDAAVRRTGAATYSLDLQGVVAYTDTVTSMLGTGQMLIDFETQAITLNGTAREVRSDGSDVGQSAWMGNATLSSDNNRFDGELSIAMYFAGGGMPGAALTGQFFGPQMNEVGASFFGSGRDGTAVVGTIMGRFGENRASAATNRNLVTLTKDVSFRSLGSTLDVRYDPATRTYQGPTSSPVGGVSQFSYNAASNSYTLSDDLTNSPFMAKGTRTFTPANIVAGQSTAEYVSYQVDGASDSTRLDLYRPAGSANPIQLTYTGWGHRVLTSGTGASATRADTWFVYGLPANGGGNYAAPTTGSATYSGTIFGSATPNLTGQPLGSLSGTASLNVDFAAGSFTGSMAPILTLLNDNSSRALGAYSFSLGTLRGIDLSAQIIGPGDDRGSLAGWLLGPNVEEFGASFSVDTFATPAAVEYALRGIIVGKKN